MNIQQFQYVLAVADTRHFETAAAKCFVTQSTLSTMVSRFEDEIGIRVFDRKRKPVEITSEGQVIIDHLRVIAGEIDQLGEVVNELKGEVKGKLSISVIPTIAPFLLPLFLQDFASRFPDLSISVNEQTTAEIVRQINRRELDIGILSIPLTDNDLMEYKLYDEPFVFYDAEHVNQRSINVGKVDMTNLCLLEDGHCMRTQVLKLCDKYGKDVASKLNFEYKAGSIDSLLRFVKANNATTLLPYLSVTDFSDEDNMHVREFSAPVPYRSVGLVTHRHFAKKKAVKELQNSIINAIKDIIPAITIKGEKLMPLGD